MQKFPKNLKMSFSEQPNMFLGMFISLTCDLHLKLDILNPMKMIFFLNGLKNEFFAMQPFLSKFQNFEIFK
jgi:hypothetical protein